LRPAGEQVASETRVALCGCGVARNKPFCDNSHLVVAFKDSAMTIPSANAQNETVTSGKLQVIPTTNGPLHLPGQVTIRNAAGKVILECAEAWLYRCGGSADKPFCDGGHERNGFQSE
jgi:CDGSH-type Zn-finger protein